MTDQQVDAGRARPSVIGTLVLLVAVIGGAVGAIAVMSDGAAHSAPTDRHTARQVRHTAVTVLRPVTATGHAAPGYRIVADGRPAIECAEASRVAVDAGIARCGSSADNTLACWASAVPRHVLCLSDPYVRVLRSIRLAGAFPVASAPRNPVPQALTLGNRTRFLARDGGAWSVARQHPSWVGYYYERGTAAAHVIYGPAQGDGIARSRPSWRVSVFTGDGRSPGAGRNVVHAYFVGTAA